MKDSPCHGCEKRFVGCHGACGEYKEFCEAREAEFFERKAQEQLPVRYYIHRKKAAYLAAVAKRGYRTKSGKAFTLRKYR